MKTGGAVAAALVFLLFAAFGREHGNILSPKEVTQDDWRYRDLALAAKLLRHVTPEEVRSLVNDRIREDIPYHEASNRRLAQNMEFVSDEASGIRHPGADELMAWFKKSPQLFQEAPRISFRQLCFSFARDGDRAHDLAARAFRKVTGQPVDSDAGTANLADHFVLPSYYVDRTPEQVAKVFGAVFARSLFQLKPGSWEGPIESASGWHLVWIDSIATGRVRSFAEVETALRSE